MGREERGRALSAKRERHPLLISFVGGPFCGHYESIHALSNGQYPSDIVVRAHDGERALYAIDTKHRVAMYWGTLKDFQRPMGNVRRQEPSSQDPHQAGQSEPPG